MWLELSEVRLAVCSGAYSQKELQATFKKSWLCFKSMGGHIRGGRDMIAYILRPSLSAEGKCLKEGQVSTSQPVRREATAATKLKGAGDQF